MDTAHQNLPNDAQVRAKRLFQRFNAFEKAGSLIDKGAITMKIRSAECLALVAIVTSATVMQIREHMQDTTAPPATQAASSCGALPNGPVPASCETARAATRDERPAEPPRHSPGIWV